MQHIEVLTQHLNPIVVAMGPRLRCSGADRDVTEYFLSACAQLPASVTFRVSGMVTGPEWFVERSAEIWGHRVEVWGPGPEENVRRCNKNDDIERDAASLLGAHALWVWTLTSELSEHSRLLDYEMIVVAKDLGVPVFLLTPEAYDYAVIEI